MRWDDNFLRERIINHNKYVKDANKLNTDVMELRKIWMCGPPGL